MLDDRRGASLVSSPGGRTAEFISSSRRSDLLLKSPPALLRNGLSGAEGGRGALSQFNYAAPAAGRERPAGKIRHWRGREGWMEAQLSAAGSDPSTSPALRAPGGGGRGILAAKGG